MDNVFASFDLWVGLFGGLALFLFGMDILTRSLKRATGDHMKAILAKLTGNRFMGAFLGAGVTSVVQSSSVTTVIMVGFISAGLMTMEQSVAVIIGANIGTTITAQILAFNITKLALPMISIGFLLNFTSKRESWREYGNILLGMGMIFYGMTVMSSAMFPLRSYEPFVNFMISLENPLYAAAIGAAFTAVIQSSSATTGILIVMASQGLIGLIPAIGIALGANIGTCVTALLASIGKPREALRAAAVHTLINVVGVLIWIGFVPQLAAMTRAISPTTTGLTGVALLSADVPRQIANAHTLFNVINAALFIGFTTQIARLVNWLLPDKPEMVEPENVPKYLDAALLLTPAIALDATQREIERLGHRAIKLVDQIMPVAVSGPRTRLADLIKLDRSIDALHQGIIAYLGEISLTRLTKVQSERLLHLVAVANDLEQIGDMVSRDLVTSAKKRLDENVVISPETAKIIRKFHKRVVKALQGAIDALARGDTSTAHEVGLMKIKLRQMSHDIALHSLERLTADEPKRVKTYKREIELIEILDGIFRLARRIARSQINTENMMNGAKPVDEPAKKLAAQ